MQDRLGDDSARMVPTSGARCVFAAVGDVLLGKGQQHSALSMHRRATHVTRMAAWQQCHVRRRGRWQHLCCCQCQRHGGPRCQVAQSRLGVVRRRRRINALGTAQEGVDSSCSVHRWRRLTPQDHRKHHAFVRQSHPPPRRLRASRCTPRREPGQRNHSAVPTAPRQLLIDL